MAVDVDVSIKLCGGWDFDPRLFFYVFFISFIMDYGNEWMYHVVKYFWYLHSPHLTKNFGYSLFVHKINIIAFALLCIYIYIYYIWNAKTRKKSFQSKLKKIRTKKLFFSKFVDLKLIFPKFLDFRFLKTFLFLSLWI